MIAQRVLRLSARLFLRRVLVLAFSLGAATWLVSCVVTDPALLYFGPLAMVCIPMLSVVLRELFSLAWRDV